MRFNVEDLAVVEVADHIGVPTRCAICYEMISDKVCYVEKSNGIRAHVCIDCYDDYWGRPELKQLSLFSPSDV